MSIKLPLEGAKFLLELRRWNGTASSQNIGPVTDRAQDRARQWCRRNRLVTYESGYWRLTDTGRELARLL